MSLEMKQGDSILWNVEDDIGDLTGVTIAAAIKRGNFYEDLTVTEVDLASGTYTITGPDTSEFPVGALSCDIKYSVGGVISKTHTFRVDMAEKVTK